MAVDLGASYPSLSIERREKQRGRRLAVFLTLAGLLAVGFFWGRWFIAEQKRKGRSLPPASAEEVGQVGEVGAVVDPSVAAEAAKEAELKETFTKLEAQLFRMMEVRHLSVADLLRAKESTALATKWQELRRRAPSATATTVVTELIAVMQNESAVARLLEAKLAHLGQAIAGMSLPTKERRLLEQRHGKITSELLNSNDPGRARRLAPLIDELEDRLGRKTAGDGAKRP
jgi:hypothetical protein